SCHSTEVVTPLPERRSIPVSQTRTGILQIPRRNRWAFLLASQQREAWRFPFVAHERTAARLPQFPPHRCLPFCKKSWPSATHPNLVPNSALSHPAQTSARHKQSPYAPAQLTPANFAPPQAHPARSAPACFPLAPSIRLESPQSSSPSTSAAQTCLPNLQPR